MTDNHNPLSPFSMASAEAMRLERDHAKERHPANPAHWLGEVADQIKAHNAQVMRPLPPVTAPATTAQQIGRAHRCEPWITARVSSGHRLTVMDVRLVAEYVLGYSDQEPWTFYGERAPGVL